MKGKFVPARRLLLILAALALVACGPKGPAPLPHDMPVDPPPGALMLTSNTFAGDALSAQLLQRINAGGVILVTTMVNMEDLDSTSSFGRMSMQQISSRVAQHGFRVTDVRLSETMRMELRSGEFMLSRNTTKLLARDYDAHAVLVGIYSRAGNRLFISTRVIRLADNAVIAAYEYYLPLSGDVRYMSNAQTPKDVSGKSTDALWSQYAARGLAFEGGPQRTYSVAAPAAASTPAAEPARPAKTGKAAVVGTSGKAEALPYGDEK